MIAVSRRMLARTVVDQMAGGTSASTVIKHLAAYLVAERRTAEVPLVMRSINEILAEKGTLAADVITARQLSGEMLNQIKSHLKKATGASNVQISEVVDDDIIGGVIIRTPLSEMDASVATTLNKLRTL